MGGKEGERGRRTVSDGGAPPAGDNALLRLSPAPGPRRLPRPARELRRLAAQALVGPAHALPGSGRSPRAGEDRRASRRPTHRPAPAHVSPQWSAEDEAAFLAGGGSYASQPAGAAAGGGGGGLASPRSLQTRAAAQVQPPPPAPPNPLFLTIPSACPCSEAGVACHWGTCLCCQDCCSNRPLGDPGASFVDMEADVYRSMVHVLLGQQVRARPMGSGREGGRAEAYGNRRRPCAPLCSPRGANSSPRTASARAGRRFRCTRLEKTSPASTTSEGGEGRMRRGSSQPAPL